MSTHRPAITYRQDGTVRRYRRLELNKRKHLGFDCTAFRRVGDDGQPVGFRMTYRECQQDAKKRGGKAVFIREKYA